MDAKNQSEVQLKTEEEQIKAYVLTLTEDEKLVIQIAKDALGDSFDLSKSNGFKKWLNKI